MTVSPSAAARRLLMIFALGLAGSAASPAATILGGIEDITFTADSDHDYNDMIFQMTGSMSIVAPGGVYRPLNASVATGTGQTYWDGQSLDGPNGNVGDCILGSATCGLPPYSGLSYLAAADGSSLPDMMFDAQGTIIATLLGEMAGLADTNVLGWYDPDHPEDRHVIFSGSMSGGDVVAFTPSGHFVLYFESGGGQTFSSRAADNVWDSPDAQHFAFFQAFGDTPPEMPTAHNPEPATVLLLSAGLGVGLIKRRRIRRSKWGVRIASKSTKPKRCSTPIGTATVRERKSLKRTTKRRLALHRDFRSLTVAVPMASQSRRQAA